GRALAQVDALRRSAPAAVPVILDELASARAEVLPRLRELWQQGDGGNPARRMRVGLALLQADPAVGRPVGDELTAWMLRAEDPAEVLLVRDALRPQAESLRRRLWDEVERKEGLPDKRFRALVALAAFDPNGAGWE